MEIIETGIKDLLVIKPKVFKDNRGYFFESFNLKELQKYGLSYDFVQDNQSYSQYGVIRGLHYQLNPYAQAKLVRVIKGKVLDVVVDLRKNSSTFGKTFSIELSDDNFLQLLVPKGFAHGFSVLSEDVIFFYKCDNYYNKEAERGIIYNDTKLDIDWQIPMDKRIISEKDSRLPNFENAEMNF